MLCRGRNAAKTTENTRNRHLATRHGSTKCNADLAHECRRMHADAADTDIALADARCSRRVQC